MQKNNIIENDQFLRDVIILLTEEGLSPHAALTLSIKLPLHELNSFDLESREVFCDVMRRTICAFKKEHSRFPSSQSSFDEFLLDYYQVTK